MTFGPDPISESLKSLQRLPADPTLAFLFPGQGSQKVGMGKDALNATAGRAVFETADRMLDMELSRLCLEGPDAELTRTANAQPAILATSVALLAAALESGELDSRPCFFAGHSLGEYTALVAAGALTFSDALRLVRLRGQVMEKAGLENPGTMAAIVGLTADEVDDICRTSGAEACNYNARTQVVVGGTADAVERACALAKERGGRGLPMNVAGAFHTSLMKSAAHDFERALAGLPAQDPMVPVMSNVTGLAMTSRQECLSDMARQVSSPVLWHQSLLNMTNAGVRKFVELGPGRALITMLKRDAPELELMSLDGARAAAGASNV